MVRLRQVSHVTKEWHMFPNILFFLGLAIGVMTTVSSYTSAGDDKRSVSLAPLVLLVAAGVAKYLGF